MNILPTYLVYQKKKSKKSQDSVRKEYTTIMASKDAFNPALITAGPAISIALAFVTEHWKQTLGLSLLLLPLFTYVSIVVTNQFRLHSSKDGREPPTIPYFIPLAGSLFSIGMDPFGFLIKIKYVAPHEQL